MRFGGIKNKKGHIMSQELKPNELSIRYTIQDDGKITVFTMTLEQIENEDLYAKLHNSEEYTCLARIIKREAIFSST